MEPQGSFALGTIIKPVKKNGEFDADIQIVMNPNANWEPKDYIDAIYDALKENGNYCRQTPAQRLDVSRSTTRATFILTWCRG